MLWPDKIFSITLKMLRPLTAAILLAVSACLVFLAEFANGRTDRATTEGGRVADLIALHNGLGCDAVRLTIAIECLTAIQAQNAKSPNRSSGFNGTSAPARTGGLLIHNQAL